MVSFSSFRFDEDFNELFQRCLVSSMIGFNIA